MGEIGEKNTDVKRVLIYRIGSLGDTVVALPCLHLIAKAYPGAQRMMLTNYPVHAKAPPAAAVISGSGLVHGYMRYSAGTRSPWELITLWWKLVRYRPDVLIYLMPVRSEEAVRRDSWFFRSAGIRHIIGRPLPSRNIDVFDEQTGLFEREASRLARSLSELGETDVTRLSNWSLQFTQDELKTALQATIELKGHRLLMCGPGTKMQAKDWGTDNWRMLAANLSMALPDCALVLLGAADDRPTAEAVMRDWKGPCLNLCGQLSPRETAAVIAQGEVFLGPDSGPMHLAAAVGVPSVIAFSARGKPGVWFPIGNDNQILYRKTDCFGCGLDSCIQQGKKCLASITVEEMGAAALRILKPTLIRPDAPTQHIRSPLAQIPEPRNQPAL